MFILLKETCNSLHSLQQDQLYFFADVYNNARQLSNFMEEQHNPTLFPKGMWHIYPITDLKKLVWEIMMTVCAVAHQIEGEKRGMANLVIIYKKPLFIYCIWFHFYRTLFHFTELGFCIFNFF